MRKTQRADWYFIVPATVVWALGLAVTARDFLRLRKAGGYRFGPANLAGLVAMVGGVAIRLAARRALGQQFAIALRTLDGHRLIQQGPYRHLRHPAYLGDLLFHLGVSWLFASARGFGVLLLLIPCFVYRMHIEEAMLVEKLGAAYHDYMRHSYRLIPGLY